jgi:hypothetical protein
MPLALLCALPLPLQSQQPRGGYDSIAAAIIPELNQLRRDPPRYARYLEQLLPHFEGTLLRRPGRSATHR